MKITGKTGRKYRNLEQFKLKCEFCGHEQLATGYEQPAWTENEVETIACEDCGKATFEESAPD